MLRKIIGLISGNFLNAVAAGILGIFVTRFLGPHDKGLLALIVGSASLLTMLFSMGTPYAASFFIRKSPDSARSILRYMNLTQAACLILSVSLVFLGRESFSRLFLDGNTLDIGLLFFLIATVIVGLGYTMFGSCVIARGEAKTFAAIALTGTLLNIALTLSLMYFLPWRLHVVLASSLAGQILAMILYRKKFSDFIPASGHQPMTLRTFCAYGFKVQVGALSNLFFKRADLFIVGYFLDTAAVGFYSLGLGLRELSIIVPRGMAGIVGGELADPKIALTRKIKLLRRSLAAALAFSVGLGAVCAVAFPYFIPLVYSRAFEPAVIPAILIMWSFTPLSLGLILTNALTSLGSPLAWSLGNTASAVVAGSLVWFLTQRDGLSGAGVAAILGATFQLGVCAFLLLRAPDMRRELFRIR